MSYLSKFTGEQIDAILTKAQSGEGVGGNCSCKKPVIVGRAIPKKPMIGDRYFFRDGMPKFKFDINSDKFDVQTFRNRNKDSVLEYYREGVYNCPVIVEIDEYFNPSDIFINGLNNKRNISIIEAPNYTGATTSPNFIISNGKYVCVKSIDCNVICGDIIISNYKGKLLYRQKKVVLHQTDENNYRLFRKFVYAFKTFRTVYAIVPCASKWKKRERRNDGYRAISKKCRSVLTNTVFYVSSGNGNHGSIIS